MSTLLMSLDLEDARLHSIDGHQYPSRVVENTELFLNYLEKNKWSCTFFTVGNIFKNHPELIRTIKNYGHEIAWHSSEHQPVETMKQEDFYADLMKGKDMGAKFGVEIYGYRAPTFSVTSKINWFHGTLFKAGYKYSSSVLPADNPLYGWKEFGEKPKICDGIFEIPMTIVDLKILKFPFGGVYLRVMPDLFFTFSARNTKKEHAIATYVHPYDFDYNQEKYIHGGINNSRFYNFLMYYNRSLMLRSLAKLANSCSEGVSGYLQFYNKNITIENR